MSKPLISVIIPVYNLEKYISYAVNSIISQDMTDWELIIVDDGSTDNTGQVCDTFLQMDRRIRVFHTPNRGVSAARNIGLEHAKGKYVAFLDGDDIYSPLGLKILFGDITAQKEIILACAEAARINNHKWSENHIRADIERFSSEEALSRLLRGSMEVSVCGKLFMKQRIGKLRFIENKTANEDKYFLFQYLINNCGEISYRHEQLYGYYSRIGSATKSAFNRKKLDTLYFSDLMIKDVKHKRPEHLQEAEFHDYIRRLEVLKHIIRTDKYKKEKPVFTEVKKELLNRYNGRSKNFYGRYIIEYYMLSVGDLPYRICVGLFDLIRKKR